MFELFNINKIIIVMITFFEIQKIYILKREDKLRAMQRVESAFEIKN